MKNLLKGTVNKILVICKRYFDACVIKSSAVMKYMGSLKCWHFGFTLKSLI